MIEVKVSTRGSGNLLSIAQFTGQSGNIFRGCRFHVNEPVPSADVWLVLEDLDDDDCVCEVPRESVVFLSSETSWPADFYAENTSAQVFLDQFTWIYSCHAIYRRNVTADLPFLPWMVNANHGPTVVQNHERDANYLRKIESLPKSRTLSVICSNQTLTADHRMRLKFVEKLKEHFQDQLDWYGNGINPIPDKWSGLADYKYSIAIENRVVDNVITEKLWDPLLTLTLPIYGGAPNVGSYLPEGSFVPIHVRDLAGSIARIESVLEADPYMSALPSIRAARDRVIGPLSLYSRLAEVALRHAGNGPVERVSVSPMADRVFTVGERRRFTRVLGEQVNKLGDILIRRSME